MAAAVNCVQRITLSEPPPISISGVSRVSSQQNHGMRGAKIDASHARATQLHCLSSTSLCHRGLLDIAVHAHVVEAREGLLAVVGKHLGKSVCQPKEQEC